MSRLFRLIWSGLALAGLLVLVVSSTPLVCWWARAYAGPWTDPPGQILIVPAADSIGYQVLGLRSYWRTVYALFVYREGNTDQIVLTGGAGVSDGIPTSHLMRNFLTAHGVPAEQIIVEDQSHSTRENARLTAELLATAHTDKTKVLLTSEYHMYRAHRVFAEAGLDVRPRPFPDLMKQCGSARGRWQSFLELVQETAKIGYYHWKGWI